MTINNKYVWKFFIFFLSHFNDRGTIFIHNIYKKDTLKSVFKQKLALWNQGIGVTWTLVV